MAAKARKQMTTNAVKEVIHTLLVGICTGIVTMKITVEISHNTKGTTMI